MPDPAAMDPIPVDALLDGYPDAIRAQADRLRAIVRRAVPGAHERVRPGWRLIGYDVPVGRGRAAYFGYIAPETRHIHLGFEWGILLDDPHGILEGAHLKLRQVRYVTYGPGDVIPTERLEALTRAAAEVAALSRDERMARREERLEGGDLPQSRVRSADTLLISEEDPRRMRA
jgi:hypothetical protein